MFEGFILASREHSGRPIGVLVRFCHHLASSGHCATANHVHPPSQCAVTSCRFGAASGHVEVLLAGPVDSPVFVFVLLTGGEGQRASQELLWGGLKTSHSLWTFCLELVDEMYASRYALNTVTSPAGET